MLRTSRVDLTLVPQRVDSSSDDEIPGHSVTIIPQETGMLVVCEDANGYATGARIPVSVGRLVVFDDLIPAEQIWVASPDLISIDVVESGVV